MHIKERTPVAEESCAKWPYSAGSIHKTNSSSELFQTTKHHNEDKYKSPFPCKRYIITVLAFKKEAEQFRNNLPNLNIFRIW